MEEKLIDRIGDEYLNPNFQDGQILLNSDVNEIVSIVKEGINANFNDIQKIQNGSHQVGNSKQLDGADLSRFSDGEMVGSDKLIPTSQQVKSYVDSKVQEIKDTTEVGKLVEDLNALSINVENKVDKEDLVNEETTGTDKAYNCDYINELFESGVGDSLPIGTIVEYDGNNIPDGFEKVEEPEDATVYVGPNEPTGGQDVWIQYSGNLFDKNDVVSDVALSGSDGTTYGASGYTSSNYIYLQVGNYNFSDAIYHIAVYDTNKNFLTLYTDINKLQLDDDSYVRIDFFTQYIENIKIDTNKKIYIKNDNGVYEDFSEAFKSEDTGWVVLNEFVQYRKKNGVVYVCGNGHNKFTVGNGDYTTVGVMPEGFRPSIDVIYFAWTGISGDIKNQSGRINNEGTIGLYLPDGQSMDNWGFIISYPVY